MSLTYDETEKLITEIDERLERLARIRVKAENIPVPVVRTSTEGMCLITP